MILVWLVVGGAVAVLSGLSIRWTVERIEPEAPAQALAWVLGGAALRWGLIVLVLILALRQGILMGLTAFLGLWLGRWAAAWYLSKSLKPSEPVGV